MLTQVAKNFFTNFITSNKIQNGGLEYMQVSLVSSFRPSNYNSIRALRKQQDVPAGQEEKQTVNFTGMTNLLGKRVFVDGQKDVVEVIKKRLENGQTSQVVGKLPGFIFERLPKENRPEAIKEILAAFSEVANEIRHYWPEVADYNMSLLKRPESANKVLNDVFKKHGVIDIMDSVNLKFIEDGPRKKVFKIDGLRADNFDEDELVFKVFKKLGDKHWHSLKRYGNYAELNADNYWAKNVGHHSQRGKFYVGDMESGYEISKYIDEDSRKAMNIVDEHLFGLQDTNGCHSLKGYRVSGGGLAVVNRIKNAFKSSRVVMAKVKAKAPEERLAYWEAKFTDKRTSPHEKAGLAPGIKYMENKTELIDKCLELKQPVVDQALAYLLKYLPENEAKVYYEKLMKTGDETTQVILMNEIPLLAKKRIPGVEIDDNVRVALGDVIKEKVYDYYLISEKYVKPSTQEHLASFTHLLPEDKFLEQYRYLLKLHDKSVYDRLEWKKNALPDNYLQMARQAWQAF